MTTALTQQPSRKTIGEWLSTDDVKKNIANALPKHLTLERFLRVALTTINRNSKLLECTRESLWGCLLDCAQLGLEPDGILGLAYLIPFKNSRKNCVECTLIVGYKGLANLAYRSGMVKGLRAEVVYEKDDFSYSLGLDAHIHHVPSDDEDPGQLKYTYCIAELEGGAKVWRVLTRRDVMKAKESSRGAGSDDSPWKTDESEMWRKTAVRANAKLLPLTPEFRDAISKENDHEARFEAAKPVFASTENALTAGTGPVEPPAETTKEIPKSSDSAKETPKSSGSRSGRASTTPERKKETTAQQQNLGTPENVITLTAPGKLGEAIRVEMAKDKEFSEGDVLAYCIRRKLLPPDSKSLASLDLQLIDDIADIVSVIASQAKIDRASA